MADAHQPRSFSPRRRLRVIIPLPVCNKFLRLMRLSFRGPMLFGERPWSSMTLSLAKKLLLSRDSFIVNEG